MARKARVKKKRASRKHKRGSKSIFNEISWREWLLFGVSAATLIISALTFWLQSLYARDSLSIAFSPVPYATFRETGAGDEGGRIFSVEEKTDSDLTILNGGNRPAAILGLRVVIQIYKNGKHYDYRHIWYTFSPIVVLPGQIATTKVARVPLPNNEKVRQAPFSSPHYQFKNTDKVEFTTVLEVRYATHSKSGLFEHKIGYTVPDRRFRHIEMRPIVSSNTPVTDLISIIDVWRFVLGAPASIR